MLLSAGCFSAMVCMLKLVSHINPVFTACLRFFFGLVAVVAIVKVTRVPLRLANKRLLLLRGLLGGLAIAMAYNAVIHLGIVKGTVIFFSYPVFGTLFGALLLKETLRGRNYLALGLAMTGLVLLVVPPGGLKSLLSIGKYELLCVSAALMSGLIVTIIRKLHETDGAREIFFSHCLIGGAILLPSALGTGLAFSARDWTILAGIGFLATAGQLAMTQGYRYLPVNKASLLSMSEVVLSCTFGILFFHEAMTVRSAAGSLLIVSACLIVLGWREKGLIRKTSCKIIDPLYVEQDSASNLVRKGNTA